MSNNYLQFSSSMPLEPTNTFLTSEQRREVEILVALVDSLYAEKLQLAATQESDEDSIIDNLEKLGCISVSRGTDERSEAHWEQWGENLRLTFETHLLTSLETALEVSLSVDETQKKVIDLFITELRRAGAGLFAASGNTYKVCDSSLVIYADEYGSTEDAAFVFRLAMKLIGRTDLHAFEWAVTCSRPVIGEFGGGYCIVTPDDILFESTQDVCRDHLEALRSLNRPYTSDNVVLAEDVPIALRTVLVENLMVMGIMPKLDTDTPAYAVALRRASLALSDVLSMLNQINPAIKPPYQPEA